MLDLPVTMSCIEAGEERPPSAPRLRPIPSPVFLISEFKLPEAAMSIDQWSQDCKDHDDDAYASDEVSMTTGCPSFGELDADTGSWSLSSCDGD